ncbi:MAG: hypothetical protein EBY29_16395, partial [Planctomycetes bacterium]|nr:hypothetical protein [Planctomycetota bacterium]
MVTYWDEPTIGMDKHLCDLKRSEPEHLCDPETSDSNTDELHHLIHRVWALNQIPNVVLSCATLPKPDEIGSALQDFKAKFAEIDGEAKDPEIHVIDSHDCKKTISLIGKDGCIALPHLLFPDYQTLITECLEHCETNKSILRYFDVQEIVRFVEHIQPILREGAKIHYYFKSIDALTLHSLKQYYLFVLREIPADQWPAIYQYMTASLMPRFQGAALPGSDFRKIKSEAIIPRTASASGLVSNDRASKPIVRQVSVSQIPQAQKTVSASSGILLTTADAHTLTDGPTIYLAEDVEKVGRFYLQQSKIPETVFSNIQQKIEKNNQCLKQIKKIEQEVELKTATPALGDKATKKAEKEPASKEAQRMLEQIKGLREAMQTVHLSS